MKITYHWCSCGGKAERAFQQMEDVGNMEAASVSFTADKSGTVQLCRCKTNQAALPHFGPAQRPADKEPLRVSG